MTRKILGVLAGYIIFVITSLALFKFSGQNPHSDPTWAFVILTIIYGAFFAFASGMVTKIIAKTNDLKTNYILALIIASFAAFSFFKADGSHWTQMLAIFIFAPVSIFGGLFIKKQNKGNARSR